MAFAVTILKSIKMNSVPRVAVCFSGGVRNYIDTYRYILKNLLNVFNPDIFIYGLANKFGANQNILELTNLYSPKEIIINTVDYYNRDEINKLVNLRHYNTKTVVPMFYNVKKCNDLKKEHEKKNNFRYDIVIRTRLDLFITKKIDLDTVNKINKDAIMIPQTWANVKSVHPLAECDGFAIGASSTINRYSQVFDSIKSINNGHPETILGIHLKNSNITSVIDITDTVTFCYPNEIDIGNVCGHSRHMWRTKWEPDHYGSKQ